MAKLENYISLHDGVSPTLNKINSSAKTAQNEMYEFKTAVMAAGTAAENTGMSFSKIFAGNLFAGAALMAINKIKDGFSGFLDTAEFYSQIQGRLSLVAKTQGEVTELNNMIYTSAQKARGGYLEMAEAVAKLSLNAKDAFPDPKEAVGFLEGIQKLFTASGTNKVEQKAAMLQLTQALGSGRLQGDEFRSISENAPELLNLISKELGVTRAQVRNLATEGKLTPEIIKNAVMHNMDTIDGMLDKMPKKWSDHWQSMKNTAIQSFIPIFEQMNQLANSNAVKVLVKNIVGAIKGIVPIFYGIITIIKGALEIIANIILTVSNFITQHSLLIELALKAIGFAFLYVGTTAAIAMGETIGLMASTAAATVVKTIADMCETAALLGLTIAQEGLNAALYACPLTWIIGLVIGFIAILYGAIAVINHFTRANISATGLIAGAFAWLFAMIANGIIFMVNMFIAFANFLTNVFRNPLSAAYNLFADIWNGIVNCVSQAVNTIIDLVNAIPGMDKVKTFGHVSGGLIERKNIIGGHTIASIQYMNVGATMRAGYKWGSNLGSMFHLPNIGAYKGGKIDRDVELHNKLRDIAGNTGRGANAGGRGANAGERAADAGERTANALESTSDDMRFLREAIQHEALNKYSPTIHIEAGGLHINNAENSRDYDGIFREFCDRVVESMENGAEGVLR